MRKYLLAALHWATLMMVFGALLVGVQALAAQIPSGPPPPPPPPPDEQGDVVKLGTTTVLVSFSAIDKGGNYVLDLTQNDMKVFEDGKEQEITYFVPALLNLQQDSPTVVMLLLDGSKYVRASLSSDAQPSSQFLRMLPPNALVAVANFGAGFTVTQTFTRDREAIQRAFDAATGAAETSNLFQAVVIGSETLDRVPPVVPDRPNRKILVVISNGRDSNRSVSLWNALREANAAGVKIFAVELRSSADEAISSAENQAPSLYEDPNSRLLGQVSRKKEDDPSGGGVSSSGFPRSRFDFEQLALNTGGLYFSSFRSANGLGPVLRDVALQVRNEYVIGYQPKISDSDGKLRKIEVRIARKGVKPQGARKGYIAERGKDEKANSRK